MKTIIISLTIFVAWRLSANYHLIKAKIREYKLKKSIKNKK